MIGVNNPGCTRGSSCNIAAVAGYFRKLTAGVSGGIFSLSENRSVAKSKQGSSTAILACAIS